MFLSAGQVPDIIRRSHVLGGTYYLRKPFDDAVLLELVGKAMAGAGASDRHQQPDAERPRAAAAVARAAFSFAAGRALAGGFRRQPARW